MIQVYEYISHTQKIQFIFEWNQKKTRKLTKILFAPSESTWESKSVLTNKIINEKYGWEKKGPNNDWSNQHYQISNSTLSNGSSTKADTKKQNNIFFVVKNCIKKQIAIRITFEVEWGKETGMFY